MTTEELSVRNNLTPVDAQSNSAVLLNKKSSPKLDQYKTNSLIDFDTDVVR